MTAPVRRKTARERDRELIAKARPWRGAIIRTDKGEMVAALVPTPNEASTIAALSALLREVNRIAKEARHG